LRNKLLEQGFYVSRTEFKEEEQELGNRGIEER